MVADISNITGMPRANVILYDSKSSSSTLDSRIYTSEDTARNNMQKFSRDASTTLVPSFSYMPSMLPQYFMAPVITRMIPFDEKFPSPFYDISRGRRSALAGYGRSGIYNNSSLQKNSQYSGNVANYTGPKASASGTAGTGAGSGSASGGK